MGSALALCFFVAVAFAASDNPGGKNSSTDQPSARHSKSKVVPNYDESVKKIYNTRFGANSPFLPSEAESASGDFIQVGAFPTAEYCGKCHEEAHKEWRESAHANSFREPFYVKNVNLLIDTKGIEFTRHCEGCHNPIALFSGALTKGSPIVRTAIDNDGITCSVCHSIVKIQSTSGTGSYVMGTPAVMVKPDGTRIPGEVSYDEILANPELHRRAVMQDFYKTPQFCAACHKAAVPRILNDYKWQRAFSVYDEWQQSSWSRENPLPFYRKDAVSTCQTCHMKPVAITAADYGAKDGKIASHRWIAANTAIPKYYGFDQQLQQTVAFLQDDTLGIDLFAAMDNDRKQQVAPLGDERLDLRPGENVTLALVIQNKKIGHSLVPEQRDFYESWVEFEVKDAAGHVLTHSGYLEPNGDVDPTAHSYTNRLIGKQGQWLDLHQVWMTHTKAYDNTILPGSSDLVRYQFTIPQDAQFPLTVSAKVNYHRFRQAFQNYVLGSPKDYPTAALGSRTVELAQSNLPETELDKNEWMRWNNYGIALLNEQQYSQAIQAFEQVVKLRPDYADGYTNVALANFRNENYDAAMQSLNKALEIAPGDARAVFYRASIERIQGNMEEAEALFQSVLERYPQMRDAHRELGYTYYQQHKYAQARQQYELLQEIDPDDLAAHYNLMLIYRRLGMKDKAAEQASYFADEKDDPTANALALGFMREHPEIEAENVPWHVHPETHKPAVVAGSNAPSGQNK
ncbi:MAG TPA: tetratricopeptide repeat protein [Terriglobales bacterium]|nr:tetratricopeptide repeat protein [Terriglobales bacterium]